MSLIDTHTHLESFARKGTLAGALERARAAGVSALVTIGTSPDDWWLYADLAKAYPDFVYYSVGLHPCSVDESWPAALGQAEAFWAAGSRMPKPVALGEIGLDRFHLPKDDSVLAERIFRWQRSAFTEGLRQAKALDVPVVIHSRGAFQECVEMIDASGVKWSNVVFHCFAEGEAEMRVLSSRGGKGSFTGILTYKNAEALRAAARLQGVDAFMVETDAPYLTPMPHRGKPNEPAYVRHTAEFAAQIFGVTYEQLALTSSATARRFFRLPSDESTRQ